MERIARTDKYFTYLRACGDGCRVVLGDARLSLARAPERGYGMIILDAFSSDAIPIHLMTSEAVGLYLTRLAPGGVRPPRVCRRAALPPPPPARDRNHIGRNPAPGRVLYRGSARLRIA